MKRRSTRIFRFHVLGLVVLVAFLVILTVGVIYNSIPNGKIDVLDVTPKVSYSASSARLIVNYPLSLVQQSTATLSSQTDFVPEPTSTPTPDPIKGYVNSNGVNFRKGNSLDSEIISVLPSESIVLIYDVSDEWTNVTVDGINGFISSQFVTEGDVPEPTPTPRYGKWDREAYLLLATTIYCEAESKGGLEEAVAVGWVIRNRLEDEETWHDDTWLDVISRKGQFSVYSKSSKSKFQRVLKSIGSATDEQSETAKRAARYVMQSRERYRIPSDVQFFCADYYYSRVKKSDGNWGSHKLYKIIGGTAFFYK